MTEYVKIKCDDCKFREDCVDYGWQECKKFTPKPSEPMTNEEWFCTLSTEEKAKWLSRHNQFMYNCGEKHAMPKTMHEEDWEWWLKQPHTNS